MARKPEQKLWDWLRPRLSTVAFCERIENRLAQGTPDIHFAHDPRKWDLFDGVGPALLGWIETKVVETPARATTPIHIRTLTAEQRIWHSQYTRAGGYSWGLVQIGTRRFALAGDLLAGYGPQPIAWWEAHAAEIAANADGGAVLDTLAGCW